ncbi:MAG: T9SS type A sorting domain-containing protein [Bacteroidales bacterium]|nr:T9SS type A sorting domain-containing protein [Bacteroidales bacterium]
MKNRLIIFGLLVLTFLGGVNAQNQFNNKSFEDWNSQNGLPLGWNTFILDIPVVGSLGFGEISKVTQAQEGDFAVQLTPAKLNPIIANLAKRYMGDSDIDISEIYFPAFLTNANVNVSIDNLTKLAGLLTNSGNLFDGDFTDLDNLQNNEMLNSLLGLLSDGLNVQSKEVAVKTIKGYYKYSKLNGEDNVVMAALLVNNTGGNRHVVGGGVLASVENSDNYTQFSIPITYLDDADELIFVVLSATLGTNLKSVSSFLLDNISIEYEAKKQDATLTEILNGDILKVYPNPAKGNIFRLNTSKIQNVKIFNVRGALIKEIPSYVPDSEIKIEESGIYIIQIGNEFAKITIE